MTLVARPGFPAASLQEAARHIRKYQDSTVVAYAGLGAASHLCGLLLSIALEVDLIQVPYPGTGPALQDLQNGQADSFAGYPLTEAEDMPDIATGAFAVAFGDFRQFYLIVDRVGVSVLRDPYSSKPYVLFYTRKRVGGGVQNFEAAKYLKFATS